MLQKTTKENILTSNTFKCPRNILCKHRQEKKIKYFKKDPWTGGQPGLHSESQNSQDYADCREKQKWRLGEQHASRPQSWPSTYENLLPEQPHGSCALNFSFPGSDTLVWTQEPGMNSVQTHIHIGINTYTQKTLKGTTYLDTCSYTHLPDSNTKSKH